VQLAVTVPGRRSGNTVDINLGRRQGFGQLWQKTFRVRLSGASVTPAEVIRVWKEH
jgi:hypothetical protein